MCDFQSSTSGGLKTHIARKHTNYSKNNLQIKCETCGEDFESEKDLKNHMITHSYSKPEFLKCKCDLESFIIFDLNRKSIWLNLLTIV